MPLGGIYAALLSPFDANHRVAHGKLRMLVRHLVKKGVDGFYVGGSSSELFSLTIDERKREAELVRKEAAGSKMIVHVGAMRVDDAVELAKHAAKCGADAISAIPPFYGNYTWDEIAAYYRALIDASGLGLFLYNIPSFTGVSLKVSQYRQLLATGGVAGIKHTSHNMFELNRFKAANPEGVVLSGYDEVFCGAQIMGADGCIGCGVNAVPEHFAAMAALLRDGRFDAAMRIQNELNALFETFMDIGFFPSVKYALSLQGIDVGECRPPILPLTDKQKARLETAFKRFEKNMRLVDKREENEKAVKQIA